MLNKILLVTAIFASGCTKYKTITRTVPIPAETCVIPPDPKPLGPIDPYDIDGDGPETDIGFKEAEVKIWLVYTYQMIDFIELLKKCPNVRQEVNEVPMRAPQSLSDAPAGNSRT